MLSLSMVVPALNEDELVDEFLEKSIRDLSAVTNDWEIVFVDDGSTDKTVEYAQAWANKYPQINIISLGRNLGNGANVEVGFQHATKEVVFNNTVDAFFNTEDLEWIVPHLEQYDSISGYRSDLSANNPYQKLLTLGNLTLIRTLFPLKLKAYQTVQFHRRSLFEQIQIEGRSSFVSPELLIKAHYLGYSIGEVEVKFHPRLKGTAKGGGLKHVVRTFRDMMKFWFKWVVLKRPIAVRRPVAVRGPGPVETPASVSVDSEGRSERVAG
ncbi:MAG TPA: glycosyltransferase family 2 protein [Phycisphaerales bacterium]|nr:glycosyltransferase family 2 protein [Phycisphaerales bacterium]